MRLVDYQRPVGHPCPSRAIASVHLDVVPWLPMTVFKQVTQAPITSVGEDRMGFLCAASVQHCDRRSGGFSCKPAPVLQECITIPQTTGSSMSWETEK